MGSFLSTVVFKYLFTLSVFFVLLGWPLQDPSFHADVLHAAFLRVCLQVLCSGQQWKGSPALLSLILSRLPPISYDFSDVASHLSPPCRCAGEQGAISYGSHVAQKSCGDCIELEPSEPSRALVNPDMLRRYSRAVVHGGALAGLA